MKYSFALASLLAGAASAQNLSTANLADVDITTAGNNTLFTRWRPTSHFMVSFTGDINVQSSVLTE